MERKPIRPVPGFVDTLSADLAARKAVQNVIERSFSLRGYDIVDTPMLEQTDLFLRKSGGELAAQMYTFTDQGGRLVSLRPEFTASVIRAFIERASSFTLPLRWQYAGPVFRYEPLERSKYRQFTQQGVEFIGAADAKADAEVISLACKGVSDLGLSGCRLDIGHIGVVMSILDGFDLSDRVKAVLVGSLHAISQNKADTNELKERLLKTGVIAPVSGEGYLASLIGCLPAQDAEAAIEGLLTGLRSETVGSRQANEIGARFLLKLKGTDKPENVDAAINLVVKLGSIKGKPEAALKKARGVISANGLDGEALSRLDEFGKLLSGKYAGLQVNVDFGMARGPAYYTGAVFEIYQGDIPLCGGGRYDGLIRALGGEEDVPALGFAYNIERLVECLARQGKLPASAENA